MIVANMIEAKKVMFLQPLLFEDDFVERGMKAWLTKIEWNQHNECYKLYFDFTEFEAENDKYFTQTYYPNRHTRDLEKTGRKLFTAKEAGMYNNKESFCFSPMVVGQCVDYKNDAAFEESIKEFLVEC